MLAYVVDRVRDILDVLMSREDVKAVDLVPEDLGDVLEALGIDHRFLENREYMQLAVAKVAKRVLIFCLDRSTPRPVFWISSRTSLNKHIVSRYGGDVDVF